MHWREHGFDALIWLMAGLLTAALLWIVGDMVRQGFEHLSWAFLTTEPEHAGRAGGIAPILVSTVLILLVALVVAVPLGLATAIWLAEFARQGGRFAYTVRISLDVLAGVPSIVYGLFGNAFFAVFLGLGLSIAAGGLTLACMILPVFIRTCEVGLTAIPHDWRRGALALGMRRSAAIWWIVLPAAAPAMIAGLMLGMGR
ncbi:MAG: phosphate ABC transporter permease PstA, partial [Mariprofundaceae bacterium]|nr:phosphate ABC transporter permease PstA [Mariprofundaceae bacterium]